MKNITATAILLALLSGCATKHIGLSEFPEPEISQSQRLENTDQQIREMFPLRKPKGEVEALLKSYAAAEPLSSAVQFTNQGKVERVIYGNRYLPNRYITFDCYFLDGLLANMTWTHNNY